MDWYRKIKPKRLKSERIRVVTKRNMNRDALRVRKPPTIRPPQFVFYRTYGKSININGYRTKVCSRYHIAKFFDVSVKTVHRWDAAGVLPKPFMILEGHRGIPYPVYLSAHFRCLVIVMRDLVADGYVTMPWHLLDEHLDMLHEGYAVATRAHAIRNAEPPDDIFDEKVGKYGVIFDD